METSAILRVLASSFYFLKQSDRVNNLVAHVQKLSDKYNLKISLTKILLESDKNANKKLALLLISSLHDQNKKKKVRKTVETFKKIADRKKAAKGI